MLSYALCTLAYFVAGTCFVTWWNQRSSVVFVVGFPFKLLVVTLLQTMFLFFIPLFPLSYLQVILIPVSVYKAIRACCWLCQTLWKWHPSALLLPTTPDRWWTPPPQMLLPQALLPKVPMPLCVPLALSPGTTPPGTPLLPPLHPRWLTWLPIGRQCLALWNGVLEEMCLGVCLQMVVNGAHLQHKRGVKGLARKDFYERTVDIHTG